MRWLVGHPGPSFSVADVYEGWVEALRGLGEDVRTFNLDRRLQLLDAAHIPVGEIDGDGRATVQKALSREQAVETAAHEIIYSLYLGWPDVVLLISAFFMPPYLLDVMRDRGHKVILLHTEEPYQCDEQLVRAAHADINLVNDPADLAAYRDLGPAEYMPHAYRESVHYPDPDAQKLWDLAFVGSGFQSRVTFFEQMDLGGLDVFLGGPWPEIPEDSPLRKVADLGPDGCVDNTQTAEIYRQSR